jgi:hypothetical protein
VIYLAILVLTALVGFLRLWLKHQRLARNRYTDIDSFKSSLQRIATDPGRPGRSDGGPATLDPGRCQEAERRIEARRSAKARR